MNIRPGFMGYGPANCFDTSFKVFASKSNKYNPGRYLVPNTITYTCVTDIIMPSILTMSSIRIIQL